MERIQTYEKQIINAFREYKYASGQSCAYFANQLGCSRQFLSKILSGEKTPGDKILGKMAKITPKK